ncbi:MAG: cation transporter [Xanthomonadales bacterium]|nr:cation transporter [Xanthomonadales bacterium]
MMMVVALVALLVNGSVLLLVLKPFQNGDVHMRAMWLCTRADVVVNLGVVLSGARVLLIHSSISDRIICIAIGLYVIKEAIEIQREAREADSAAPAES